MFSCNKAIPANAKKCLPALLLVAGYILTAADTVRAGTDFTTNNTSDLAVFVPASATWRVPSAGINMVWGWNEAHPVPGDFNGDQSADMAVYHRQAARWYIRTQLGAVLAWNVQWGYKDAHAVTGDYNNDGADDLALYDPLTAAWFIRSLTNTVITWNLKWGASYFQPVPGDYDGDGSTDLALYDRVNGRWYIRSLTAGVLAWAVPWGMSTARPVPGDYDGDGRHDLAVYDKQAGVWYIRKLDGTVLAWATLWGFPESRSVPGDYNGDGSDDLGVYYAPLGTWYVMSLSNSAALFFGTQSGDSNSVPVGMYAHGGEGHVVLAHGDSLTFGRGSSSNGPATSYPKFLDDRMETEFGGLTYVINAGVPGETTTKGKDRLPLHLAKHKPTLVLILEGTNDLFFQRPDWFITSNLTVMANAAKSNGASVVMATLPPIVSRPLDNRDIQHARVQMLNPGIRSLAGDLGWTYAETYNSLTSRTNWQNTLFKRGESLHPNDAGYRIFRDEFIKSIRKAMNTGRFIY